MNDLVGALLHSLGLVDVIVDKAGWFYVDAARSHGDYMRLVEAKVAGLFMIEEASGLLISGDVTVVC